MNKKMVSRKRLAGMSAFALVAAAALVGTLAVTTARAADTAIVHPDPLSVGMRSGEEKSVSIRVDNAQDLYGIEFQVHFDPRIIQVQDADSSADGVQIEVGEWLADGFVAANQVDNKKGTILYAATLLNPAPPLNGDGTVATIQFSAKNDGTSPLTISKTLLATRDATEIESEAQNGAIGVSALGQAPQVSNNTSGNKSKTANNANSNAQPGLSITNLLLVGAAGVGVLAFGVALVVLLGIVFLRRKN